jgi:hypothetical protein
MIRKLMFIGGLVLLSVTAFSQAQFALGVKGGLNFATFDVQDVAASLDNKTGYHAGAFALLKVAKFGIQPEFIFSQQGTKIKNASGRYSADFTYLNVPIMLKCYLIGGLNIHFGPQFGFLRDGDGVFIDANGDIHDTGKLKELYRQSDMSIGVGAGWDLPFGLTIDARYNIGLEKIDNDANALAAKNQVIQVSVGYKIIKLGGGK